MIIRNVRIILTFHCQFVIVYNEFLNWQLLTYELNLILDGIVFHLDKIYDFI